VTEADDSIRSRLSRQGEQALGRVAEELARSPVVGAAVSSALEARQKASEAQEAALGALSIPSAADVEQLTRRLRSVSQRLEAIEDVLDRFEGRLDALIDRFEAEQSDQGVVQRLDDLAGDMRALREAAESEQTAPPRGQERFTATDS
jgi:TolA-binding protein